MSGGTDGVIMIWDLADALQPIELTGHNGLITDLAILPNGQIASAGNDGSIRLWSPDDGSQLALLDGHTGPVRGLAALVDGHIASIGADATVRLWSTDDGTQLDLVSVQDESDQDSLLTIAALGDGRLVVGGIEGVVRLIDFDADDQVQTITTIQGSILSIAPLGTDQIALTARDNALHIVETNSGTERATHRLGTMLKIVAKPNDPGLFVSLLGSGWIELRLTS